MKPCEKSRNIKLTVRIFAVVLFCLFLSTPDASAKTLAEYRAGIQSAKNSTRKLSAYVDEMIHGNGVRNVLIERQLTGEIRQSLPVTEKIEWEGNSLETGNQWLESKLKSFEDDSETWSNRQTILKEIGERLDALETKIGELDKTALSDRSKDEEKRKLAEILRRPEYQKPQQQEESWFEKMRRKIREWFNRKFPQPEVPEGAEKSLNTVSFGLQMLLYALVLGFIAFLIYRFAPLFADKFKRRQREEKGERVILGEKLSADEDAQTLFDEAESLARQGNLRGAIRKGYIALLCELSDRKIIGLAQHKTNRDYLRDVRKKDELYKNMNGLTDSYERHWYGFDDADETDWNEFKQIYQKAISS